MQLAYRDHPIYGVEGEKSDSSPSNVVSKINDGNAAIPVGRLVVFGDDDKSCQLVQTKEDVEKRPLGVSLYERRAADLKPAQTVSVLRQGRVFVHLESDAKAAGDPVYVTPGKAAFGGKKDQGSA